MKKVLQRKLRFLQFLICSDSTEEMDGKLHYVNKADKFYFTVDLHSEWEKFCPYKKLSASVIWRSSKLILIPTSDQIENDMKMYLDKQLLTRRYLFDKIKKFIY